MAKASAKSAPVTEEVPITSAESQLDRFLKANKTEHFNFVEDTNYSVSTGSLSLDQELLFHPSMVRLVGPSSAGKSSFALNVVKEFFKAVPNSRAVYIKAESRLSDEIQQRSGLTFTKDAANWANETVFIFESNIYEVVIGLIRELITNNPSKHRYMFIVDSMDGLNLREDIVKTIDQNVRVAGQPLMTKQFLQKVSVAMAKLGHLCFFLSQVSAEIKLDPYAKGTPRQVGGSGGSAVQHFASHVLEFQNWYESDLILENPEVRLNSRTNKALGHICKVKIVKTDKEARYTVVEIPIKHNQSGGGSIWLEREVGDAMLVWQLISKTNPMADKKDGAGKGSWLYFAPSLIAELTEKGFTLELDKDNNFKLQGMKQLYDFLESNKPITDYLFAKFKANLA